MEQTVVVTPYWYTIKYDDGSQYIHFFNTKDELFYDVSKCMAYRDCDNSFEITKIMCEEDEAFYFGWLGNNEYKFINTSGETVWDTCLPNLEH